jgi:hypothetical protein
MYRKYVWRVFSLCAMILVAGSFAFAAEKEQTAESQTGTSHPFTIERMVVATGVEDREPVGVAEKFPQSTEKVYCFIEAKDVTEDTKVEVVWFHSGNKLHTYELGLQKGSRWRTFAYKNLRGMTGEWKVELKDSAGNTIQSLSFLVEG